MKEGIHPKYEDCVVTCACGYTFTTRSTKPIIKLEICSNCHPFYTGKQKLIDTAGRVEKFQKRFASTEGKTIVRKKAVRKTTAKPKKTTGKILTTSPKKAKPTKKDAKKEKK